MKTKIFCDSADYKLIKFFNNKNLVDGFTTNPSLMRLSGAKSYKDYSLKILKICKRKPISFEVFADNPKEMLNQAYKINKWGKNVYVKIPVVNSKGFFMGSVIRELINKGSKLIGLGARDTLRLEAGLCLYGHDLDKDKTPVEANLKWAISKERISKGDFIGSDIIIKQLNNGVSKIRVGIKPEGRIIAREKTKIFNQ